MVKSTNNTSHNAGRWSYTRTSNLKVRRQEKRWKVKSTNNILLSVGSRAYTGTTTTRKVIKLIKRVLQSEESKNEGRFKTTYNSLLNAKSRAYTGTTTTRKVIKLIKRAYNPKKVGAKEGLKQPTTLCIT